MYEVYFIKINSRTFKIESLEITLEELVIMWPMLISKHKIKTYEKKLKYYKLCYFYFNNSMSEGGVLILSRECDCDIP